MAEERFQEEEDDAEDKKEAAEAEWHTHCAFMSICIVWGVSDAVACWLTQNPLRGCPVSREALLTHQSPWQLLSKCSTWQPSPLSRCVFLTATVYVLVFSGWQAGWRPSVILCIRLPLRLGLRLFFPPPTPATLLFLQVFRHLTQNLSRRSENVKNAPSLFPSLAPSLFP